MPADLFYFLSSLPTLRWSEKPPMNHAEFLARCADNLGKEYAKRLTSLQLLPSEEATSPLALQWRDFESFVRNTVAELRKAKLRGQKVTFTPRPTTHLSPGDAKRLEEIMAQSSPLERENALDLFRWKYLDDLASAHFYDFASLEIYALKLLLLDKQASRQFEAGQAAFTTLMEEGLKKARTVRNEENV